MMLRLAPIVDASTLPSWARVVVEADAPADLGRAPTDVVHDGTRWHDAGRAIDDAGDGRTRLLGGIREHPGEQVIELHDVVVSSDGSVWHDDVAVTGRGWGLPARPGDPPTAPVIAELDGLVANATAHEKAFGHWLLHRLPRLHTLRTRTDADRAVSTAMPWNDAPLLAAAGYPPDSVTLLRRGRPQSARVERLALASQASLPGGDRHIDRRRLDAVIRRLDDQWQPGQTPPDLPRDIYVARRDRPGERRGCRNAANLEEFFTELGFTAIYPPDLPIEQQFAMFRGARSVVGEFGSGTIWAMVCEPGTSVVQVTSSAGTGHREYDPTRRSWNRAIADARGQHYGQIIASAEVTERGWTADLAVVRRAWATRPPSLAPHLPR